MLRLNAFSGRCPTGDDPGTSVDETDCESVEAAGGFGIGEVTRDHKCTILVVGKVGRQKVCPGRSGVKRRHQVVFRDTISEEHGLGIPSDLARK